MVLSTMNGGSLIAGGSPNKQLIKIRIIKSTTVKGYKGMLQVGEVVEARLSDATFLIQTGQAEKVTE